MVSIDVLKEFGANTDEALARCLNNEEFYLKLVDMGIHDEKFESLGTALSSGNLDEAFEICHALKGVLGNLSLDPINNITSEMTELLRSREDMDYMPMYDKMMGERKRLLEMIG